MAKKGTDRVVGVALWLVNTPTWAKRVEWVVRHGLGGVSLHHKVLDLPQAQRQEAAAAMREAGLVVTYHGGIAHKLTADGQLDEGFVSRLIDDVLWWHENAGGLRAACMDPVLARNEAGTLKFLPDVNRRFVQILGERLGRLGIRIGIENSFGGPDSYQSPSDVAAFAAACWPVPNHCILVDAGHVNVHLGGRQGVGDYIRALPLPIAEVHVTDNMGQHDEHRHLGYGTLDAADLVRGLRDVNYDGPLTIEVCVDILNGLYGADIANEEQVRPILVTRDRLMELWP